MNPIESFVLGVVGAGAMGRGIAQLFAQAGHVVKLYDTAPAAVEAARASIGETLAKLAEKGRISAQEHQQILDRIQPTESLGELAPCDLVIEAVIEQLEVKKRLFAELESIVDPQAILATNTSSLSVTSIAAACARPQRVAGYHFFNPVPLMKVVEVIQGTRTDPATLQTMLALTARTTHAAVIAADTPGFLINHAGRGYGTEALRLLSEGVADVATIDLILREQVVFEGGGFRLGPFELLDLTGLDVSHPVMESIYRQFYEEPRFRPSALAALRMAGGLLGRKSGEGFYRYPRATETPAVPVLGTQPTLSVWIAPGPDQERLGQLVLALGGRLDAQTRPAAESLCLVAPLGQDASTATVEAGLSGERVIAIDTLFPFEARACKRRVLMRTPATNPALADAASRFFAGDGAAVSLIRDSAGFVAQRVVAMVVAVSCEIAQQRIASPADIDLAVRLGLGYPVGPLSMGDAVGARRIAAILDGMQSCSGDPRYRPSLWLRRRAQLGLSLLQAD